MCVCVCVCVYFLYFYLFIWLCRVLVVACGAFSCGMWDQFLQPGIEPRALHWALGVLATGLPRKSLCMFKWMYSFARAAIAKYNKLGDLEQQTFIISASGSWKSDIKLSTELVLSRGQEGKSVSCPFPGFW